MKTYCRAILLVWFGIVLSVDCRRNRGWSKQQRKMSTRGWIGKSNSLWGEQGWQWQTGKGWDRIIKKRNQAEEIKKNRQNMTRHTHQRWMKVDRKSRLPKWIFFFSALSQKWMMSRWEVLECYHRYVETHGNDRTIDLVNSHVYLKLSELRPSMNYAHRLMYLDLRPKILVIDLFALSNVVVTCYQPTAWQHTIRFDQAQTFPNPVESSSAQLTLEHAQDLLRLSKAD